MFNIYIYIYISDPINLEYFEFARQYNHLKLSDRYLYD